MNIRELEQSEWNEVGRPIYIGQIPFDWKEIENILGLTFTDIHEDGLLPEKVIFIEIQGHAYKLRGIIDTKPTDSDVSVSIRSYDDNPKEAVQFLAKHLGIEENAIKSTA